MIFIFIGYMEDLISCSRLVKDICNKQPGQDYFIVSMNRFTDKLSNETGLPIRYIEEFLNKEDYEYMESTISKLCDTWHLDCRTRAKDLADILQWEAYVLFCTALKNLHITLKVLEKINPEKIFFISENENDHFDAIASFAVSSLGVKSECINIKLSFYSAIKDRMRSLKEFLSDVMSRAIDYISALFINKKIKSTGLVLTDYKLIDAIKGMDNEFRCIPYIVGRGLRKRVDFLKNKRMYFAFSDIPGIIHSNGPRYFFRGFRQDIEKRFKDFKYRDFFIGAFLCDILTRMVKKRVMYCDKNLSMLCDFLKKFKPEIILVRDSVRTWESLLTKGGKNCGVRTLIIQHGLATIKNIYARQNADFMAVWGRADIDWFKSVKNHMPCLEITGDPFREGLLNSQSENSPIRYRDMLKNIGADPKVPAIIYMGNSIRYYPIDSVYLTPDLSLFSLMATLNAFNGLKDLQLIIKVHPYYTKSEFLKFKEAISGFKNVFILEQADLCSLFNGAKAVIYEFFSSSMLDAIILKRPVIFYNFFMTEELVPLKKRGVGIEISRPEDIRPWMERLISGDSKLFMDRDYDSFMADYSYKIDGQASNRIKDFMRDLIKS